MGKHNFRIALLLACCQLNAFAQNKPAAKVAEPQKTSPSSAASKPISQDSEADASTAKMDGSLKLKVPTSGTGSGPTDPRGVPSIERAPDESIAAYLGQTLELSAAVPKLTFAGADQPFVAWVLNGNVICENLTCSLELDGKTLKAGSYSLLFIAYNSFGSVMTNHTLHILQGKWKPPMPFDKKHKKVEPSKVVKVKITPVANDKLNIAMLRGHSVFSRSNTLQLVGHVPVNFTWEGRLRTGKGGVAHLTDPKRGEWYLLRQSDVTLQKPTGNTNPRPMKLHVGGVRLFLGAVDGAAKDKDKKKENKAVRYREELPLETNEISLIPEEGADIYLTRVAPNAANLKKRAARKPNEPLPVEEMFSTHVVVISGKAAVRSNLQKDAKAAEVPPGVELVIYENGFSPPLGKPNSAEIERLYKATFPPVIKKKVDEQTAKKIDLPAHLKKVEELIEREDYFEALGELSLVESRAAEDVRIPYYIGVANKGLYQATEAEKYLQTAMKQDPEFPLPPWQLAQMRLDEKKWAEAKTFLDEAGSRMDASHKLYPEYLYYVGVANYQIGSSFSAKSDFMRALWESQLDSALKSSAGGFLSTMGKQKPWSLVVPAGVQYDANALGLEPGAAITAGFNRKHTFRGILGTIFNYDTSPTSDAHGLYHGAGAKAIVVRNFPSGFEAFDAIVTGVNAIQTLKKAGPLGENKTPTTESIVFNEGIDVIFVNNKRTIDNLNLSVNYQKIDMGFTFEHDPVNKGTAARHAMILKEAYPFAVGPVELPVSADQRYVLNKSASNGHALSATVTPAYTWVFSPRSNVKAAVAVGGQYTMVTPSTKLIKASPSVNYSYFLTPYLLSILGASYEVSMEKPTKSKLVHKPGASLMLTGLF